MRSRSKLFFLALLVFGFLLGPTPPPVAANPARFTLTKRGVSRSIGFGPLRYSLGAVACAGPGGYGHWRERHDGGSRRGRADRRLVVSPQRKKPRPPGIPPPRGSVMPRCRRWGNVTNRNTGALRSAHSAHVAAVNGPTSTGAPRPGGRQIRRAARGPRRDAATRWCVTCKTAGQHAVTIIRRASSSPARPWTLAARPTGTNGSPSKTSPPKSWSF
jgi:hypothetical protein